MKVETPNLNVTSDAPPWGRQFARLLSTCFAMIKESLLRVSRSQIVSVIAPASAGTAFTVQHSLMVKPGTFTYEMQQAGSCYATAADRREWDETKIRLRCSVAGAPLVIQIIASE